MSTEPGSRVGSTVSGAASVSPSILGPLIAGTIGYWACQLFANVPVALNRAALAAYARFPLNVRLDIVRSEPGVFLLYHAFGALAVMSLVAVCTHGDHERPTRLGLPLPSWSAGHWSLAFTAYVGLKLVIIGLHILVIGAHAIPISYLETPVHPSGYVLPELGLSVLAGIAVGWSQELLFRGYVQRGLAPRLGTAAAIGWSSLLLAAGQGWPLAPLALIQSLFLSWLVARTDSIQPAIVLHAIGTTLTLVVFEALGGYLLWMAHATNGTIVLLLVIGASLFIISSRRLSRAIGRDALRPAVT